MTHVCLFCMYYFLSVFFSHPLGVRGWRQLVIVALPRLFINTCTYTNPSEDLVLHFLNIDDLPIFVHVFRPLLRRERVTTGYVWSWGQFCLQEKQERHYNALLKILNCFSAEIMDDSKNSHKYENQYFQHCKIKFHRSI